MVRIHLIRLLLQKCTKNGTYFIKSRRRKPVLAGFELLLVSRNFLGQIRIGLERLGYVLSGFHYRNIRKTGLFYQIS